MLLQVCQGFTFLMDNPAENGTVLMLVGKNRKAYRWHPPKTSLTHVDISPPSGKTITASLTKTCLVPNKQGWCWMGNGVNCRTTTVSNYAQELRCWPVGWCRPLSMVLSVTGTPQG